MSQLLVRKFDETLKTRLRERARRRGVSMEEEARTILRAALMEEAGKRSGLGTRIAALFKDIDWENDRLEPFPSSEVRPASFD